MPSDLLMRMPRHCGKLSLTSHIPRMDCAFRPQNTHYRAAVNYTQRALEESSERLYSFYQAVRSCALDAQLMEC